MSAAAAQAEYRRQQQALAKLEKRFAVPVEPQEALPLSGRFWVTVDGAEYDIYIEEM